METTQFLINPLTIYEHIKTKQKINFLDSHHYLPWVLFSDKFNNIIIYDVDKKHVIRAFTLSQYLPEDVIIKRIQFFDCIDQDYIKKYIDEYENQPTEHYIEWISLQTKAGNQRKILNPGDRPVAEFAIFEGDEVIAAFAYCNLHSLWRS